MIWSRTSCSHVAVMRSFRGESVGHPNFSGYLPKSRKSFPMIDLNSPVLSSHQYIKRSRTRFRRSQRIILYCLHLYLKTIAILIRCAMVWHGIYWTWRLTVIYLLSFGLTRGRNCRGQFVGWCIIRLTCHYRRLLVTSV